MRHEAAHLDEERVNYARTTTTTTNYVLKLPMVLTCTRAPQLAATPAGCLSLWW